MHCDSNFGDDQHIEDYNAWGKYINFVKAIMIEKKAGNAI
jgi:hypothetical protein